jgi:zinc transport system substrate-binding protein
MNRTRLGPPMRAPLLAAALAACALAGCSTPAEPSADVLATFYPLEFVASRIAGGNVTVAALEPSPGDAVRVSGAKVLLAQGAGFEPWLAGLLENARGSAEVVETTQGLPLRASDEGVDPHTWLDPTLLAEQSRRVEDALAARFPEHADAFRGRGAALREDLGRLHAELEAGLASCGLDVIIANHDAYGYLAARYNFTVVSISGLSPEAEPSPEALAHAIDVAREHNVTVVFFEELASPRVVQVVAEEVGASTRVLSPVEGLDEDARAAGEDYVSLMRENLAGLREAMRCP